MPILARDRAETPKILVSALSADRLHPKEIKKWAAGNSRETPAEKRLREIDSPASAKVVDVQKQVEQLDGEFFGVIPARTESILIRNRYHGKAGFRVPCSVREWLPQEMWARLDCGSR